MAEREDWAHSAEERRDKWRRWVDQRIYTLFALIAVMLTIGACVSVGGFWWCATLEQRVEDQRYVNDRAKEFQYEVRDFQDEVRKALQL